MKKFVFASVMALASLSLVSAPTLRAQDQQWHDSNQGSAEFNAYPWPPHSPTPRPKRQPLKIS